MNVSIKTQLADEFEKLAKDIMRRFEEHLREIEKAKTFALPNMPQVIADAMQAHAEQLRAEAKKERGE